MSVRLVRRSLPLARLLETRGLGQRKSLSPVRWLETATLGVFHAGKPTIEEAKAMPRHYFEFPNDVLLTMAANGDHDAREERLTREVMAVEDISWEGASSAVM